ncbi:DUF4158 domain-containing protein, partial [Escherichia sp. R-CC3]
MNGVVIIWHAKRLGIVPAAIQHYAKIRDTTRREHIGKIRKHFGFRSFTLREYRELAVGRSQFAN